MSTNKSDQPMTRADWRRLMLKTVRSIDTDTVLERSALIVTLRNVATYTKFFSRAERTLAAELVQALEVLEVGLPELHEVTTKKREAMSE